MPGYRADVRWTFNGQLMESVLWYRDTGSDVGLDGPTAASGLGASIRDNIILVQVGQTRLANLLAASTLFTEVSVMRVSLPDLVPLLNAPVVTSVNLASVQGALAFSPQAVYILSLRCAVGTIAPGDYTPSRGYLALGPATEGGVAPTGQIEPVTLTELDNFGAAIQMVQPMGGGFTATPIRVGRGANSFGAQTNGFADITDVQPATIVSWRRSRTPG